MTGSLAASLRLQSTIVHALIMQDMNRRHADSRLGSLMAIVEPLLLLVGIYFLRTVVKGAGTVGGVPIALFLVTGFLVHYCFRRVVQAVMTAGARKASAQALPQVTSLDVVAAQALSTLAVFTAVMIVGFTALMLGYGIRPNDTLMVFIGSGLTLLLGIAVGLAVVPLVRVFPGLRMFIGLLLRIDMVFSGAAFLASEVPTSLLPYVSWNPTFHTIEMMREAWFPGYVSPIADPAYVVAVFIVLLAIGLAGERLTSRGYVR